MCVILDIKPGATIPPDMFELACDINKDGFGMSWLNEKKKRFTTVRDVSKNDWKAIHKDLEKLKDHRVFLHLRHATVGEVNIENNHPFFPITRKDGDGKTEIGFMHNGTLWGYKPADTKVSDTKLMNDIFLRPFLLRCLAFSGDKVLDDLFMQSTVASEIGAGESVFLLFDNHGNVVRLGKEGKEYEGFWASNTYSFDKQHHRSSQKTQTTYPGNYSIYNTPGDFNDDLPFSKWSGSNANHSINMQEWEQELAAMENKETFEIRSGAFGRKMQMAHIGLRVRSTTEGNESMNQKIFMKNVQLDVPRRKFLAEAGLKSYDDLKKLTHDNFADLCREYPQGMADLFVDLLIECDVNKKHIQES